MVHHAVIVRFSRRKYPTNHVRHHLSYINLGGHYAIHSRYITQARLHLGIPCSYEPCFSHLLPAICVSRKRKERNSQAHGKASALRRAYYTLAVQRPHAFSAISASAGLALGYDKEQKLYEYTWVVRLP